MNKQLRLKDSREIEKIVLKRIRVGSELYNMYYSYNNNETKIAVVCGKKCGNAVIRNHEKRVMREIIKEHIDTLQGLHIVLVCKPETINKSFEEKKTNINYLINKIMKGRRNEQNKF